MYRTYGMPRTQDAQERLAVGFKCEIPHFVWNDK